MRRFTAIGTGFLCLALMGLTTGCQDSLSTQVIANRAIDMGAFKPDGAFLPDISMVPDSAPMLDGSAPMDGMHRPPLDQSTAVDMSTARDAGTPIDMSPPLPSDATAPELHDGAMEGAIELPTFDYLDTVVDLARSTQRVWAHFIYADQRGPTVHFVHQGYEETGEAVDFWPASTIKMFAATAVLSLLEAYELSLDATATFYRETNNRWVEDTTITFREMIHRTFNCSSNETYTLLLRLAGIDWINTAFFTEANGFRQTALMRGYVSADARPWVYVREEAQRIVMAEGERVIMREHAWSGRSYANDVDCVIYNESGTGNCTTPRDMAEHLRRLIFLEMLPVNQQFNIGGEALDWYRGGGPERILNNTECGGPAYAGVQRVFQTPIFHHKGGLVSDYRASIMHVEDQESHTNYFTAIAVNNSSTRYLRKISEEIARMAKTPGLYVHLDSLVDHVNPVRADLVIVAKEPAVLDLVIKPYADDGHDLTGWQPLQGTETHVPLGHSAHALQSLCLDQSEQVHIRGRLRTDSGRTAYSDLHYVIIDHRQPCP